MPWVERISSPMSESWTGWVLLALLLMAGWAIQRQPALLRVAWKTSFAKAERNYSDAALDLMVLVLLTLFRIGTVALALNVLFYRGDTFEGMHYLLTLGVLAGVEMAKLPIIWLVNYAFRLPLPFGLSYIHYTYLWMLICMPLWLINCVMVVVGNTVLTQVLMAVMAVGWAMALLVKGVRTYMNNWASIAYIVLYIITVEVVPLTVAAYIIK